MSQKPIRYVTVHCQDRDGAVSLRCRKRAEITVLMCQHRKPIQMKDGFRAGARALQYIVDIKPSTTTKNTLTKTSKTTPALLVHHAQCLVNFIDVTARTFHATVYGRPEDTTTPSIQGNLPTFESTGIILAEN